MSFLKNMSFLTNAVSLLLMLAGKFSPFYGEQLYQTGLFAFSGAITNWLAIYLLFEKVPFLYGSGVIPARFEEFKVGIKEMLMQQFFRQDILENFLQQHQPAGDVVAQKITALKGAVDVEKIYTGLVEAILSSSFGGMLKIFGGADALKPLREPMMKKISEILDETLDTLQGNQQEQGGSGQLAATLQQSVQHIIDGRLAELTPQMVKKMVQQMISKHLGWLVLWGGVFGGLIGLVMSV